MKSIRRRLVSRRCLLVLGGLLATSAALPAATPSWQPLGPYGGVVSALAVSATRPSIVYAGTLAGLFRSSDDGAHWALTGGTGGTVAGVGLPDAGEVDALVTDPRHPARAFAVVNGLVCRTDDGGGRWIWAGAELRAQVRTLALDPSDSDTVYAGTYQDVFVSHDGGFAWEASPIDAASPRHVTVLAAAAGRRTSVYAADSGGALYVSRDGGAHWSPLVAHLANHVVRLLPDPGRPGTLYAGTEAGVAKSIDAGAHWQALDLALPSGMLRGISALALAPGRGGRLYAGGGAILLASDDGGRRWTRLAMPASAGLVLGLTVDPRSGAVYAATVNAVLRSADRGASWQPSSNGILAIETTAVAVDPVHTTTLYVGSNLDGVFASDDAGRTWQPRNDGLALLGVAWVSAVTVAPSAPATLYAATGRGVFRSADAGRHWSPAGAGLPSYAMTVVVDPLDARHVVAGTDENGVYTSSDGGATWSAASLGLDERHVNALVSDPAAPQRLFAGTSRGLYRSTDGAATWNAVGGDLATASVSAVVLEVAHPGLVLALTGGGLWRSDDGAATWKKAADVPGTLVTAVAVDPADAAHLFVGAGPGYHTSQPYEGLYESHDGGARWARVAAVPPTTTVRTVAFDRTRQRLLVGTEPQSLFALTLAP